MNKQPTKMRWLPAALLLSASCYPAVAIANARDVTTYQRRTALSPEPKSLGRFPDALEDVAIATHSAVAKMAREGVAPSNDDPELMEQLLMSIHVNGTKWSRAPTMEPAPLIPASSGALIASLAPTAGPKTPRETLVPSAAAELVETQATQPPTESPTLITNDPSPAPSTAAPSPAPSTEDPSPAPSSSAPSPAPSSAAPSPAPSTEAPSPAPSTAAPTYSPSTKPTTSSPSWEPTPSPSLAPTPSPQLSMIPSAHHTESTVTRDSLTDSPSSETLSTEVPTVASTNVGTGTMVESTQYPTSDTDDGAAETLEPTVVPTYSPTVIFTTSPTTMNESYQNSMSNSTSNSLKHQDLEPCPAVFKQAVHYQEGDVVAVKRSRRNCGHDGKRGNTIESCHVMFRCKPWPEGTAYCNTHKPGKHNSDKGWLELSRCTIVSIVDGSNSDPSAVELPGEKQVESPSSVPTKYVPPSVLASSSSALTTKPPSSALRGNDTEKGRHTSPSPTFAASSVKIVSTSYPTSKRQSGYSPMWSKPTVNIDNSNSQSGIEYTQEDTSPPDAIAVKLPRVICDISVSPSLSSTFQHKHVLLAAMTNSIYDLFDARLNQLFDLARISLNVEIKRNGNIDNDVDSESVSSATSLSPATMVRVHAYLTGAASFSLQGAPTPDALLALLVRYFDVDEFNRRLSDPLRVTALARTAKSRAEETIKVNSVFFTLDDGSLILAGSTYEEYKFPTTTTVAQVGQPGDNKKIQVSFIFSAFIAMTCVLAMIMLLLYSNRLNDDDEQDNNAIPSTDESRLEEGQSKIAERGDSLGAGTKVEVEIEVPSTPQIAMSDVSEDNSVLSALSESPFTVGGSKRTPPPHCYPGLEYYTSSAATSPSQGIGIAKPNCYRYSGDSTLGFGANRNWEMYHQDTAMMESP